MTTAPTVYIVSGVHNNLLYTKKLLASICEQSYKNFEVIIVDDGSSDGTGDYISKFYPQVRVLTGNGTLWWTGCSKIAVDFILNFAKAGSYILTVNNDCQMPKNFLDILITQSNDNKRAILGSVVVDAIDKKTIVDAGVKISWLKGSFKALGPHKVDELPIDGKINWDIDTLTTKGTLYPIEVFKIIGNFDAKHLPHYLSDYEFACRAKRNGFRLGICFNAILYNFSARTGYATNLPKRLTLTALKSTLFGRKSKRNIIDHFWFITLACPPVLKPYSYLLLLLKTLFISLKAIAR